MYIDWLRIYDSDHFYPNQVFFCLSPFQPCQVLSQARHFDRWQNASEREQGAQTSWDSDQWSHVLDEAFVAHCILQNDGSTDHVQHLDGTYVLKLYIVFFIFKNMHGQSGLRIKQISFDISTLNDDIDWCHFLSSHGDCRGRTVGFVDMSSLWILSKRNRFEGVVLDSLLNSESIVKSPHSKINMFFCKNLWVSKPKKEFDSNSFVHMNPSSQQFWLHSAFNLSLESPRYVIYNP